MSPSLILLNGAPGIGKSTLAQRYAQHTPMALCLDLDAVRRQIGQWESAPEESGRLARDLAVAMVGVHLGAGHDVVIPQYVADEAYLDRLAATAAERGAGFAHVVLTDDREQARERFEARADDPALAMHHEVAMHQIDGAGGFGRMYDAVEALRVRRAEATTLWTRAGGVDEAYWQLTSVVRSARP